MYKEMVFYIESCESGSMFPDLTEDMKVYAMTASNATESSWGAYCGKDAKVDGVKLGTCLGDLFSVNWMQNTEAQDIFKYSIDEQYTEVKEMTTKSPVCEFGDLDMKQNMIGVFEGDVKEGKYL